MSQNLTIGGGTGGALRSGVRTLAWAARSGLTDYGVMFTVRTWLFGWCLRIFAQVLFFVTIGQLLGPLQMRYVLIGNVAMVVAMHSLMSTASTTWERDNGTLALLVASPSPPELVLIGRSLFWIPEGLVCAVGALVVVAPIAGMPLSVGMFAAGVPLLLLIGLSCYALGMFLGALVLNAVDLRNVVSNIAITGLMILAGVNVPVSFLGPVVRPVTAVLPLTHGLRAFRVLLAGGPGGQVFAAALAEFAVGAGWLVMAIVVLRTLARRSRRDARILFT